MAGLVVFISIWQKQGVRNKPTILCRGRRESVKNVAHQQKIYPPTEQVKMKPAGTEQPTAATPKGPLRLATVEVRTTYKDITNAHMNFLNCFLFSSLFMKKRKKKTKKKLLWIWDFGDKIEQKNSIIFFFIIQRVKARAIPCPHQPPSRGDNTVSVAQGGTATPGATKQLLPPDRVLRGSCIYIYIYTPD